MSLVLEYNDTEKIVRSIDDTPGVLGLPDREEGGLAFVIYHRWEPTDELKAKGEAFGPVPAGVGLVVMDVRDSDAPGDVSNERTEVEIEEVVDACKGDQELAVLQGYWTTATQTLASQMIPGAWFERLGQLAQSGVEFRDAMWRRWEREHAGEEASS